MPVRKAKKSALEKKKSDPNSAYWKKKADMAWGAVVHGAGGGCVCAILGDCKGPLEAHHLITRGIISTRHDPRNGVLLCSYHHKWSKKCSPHMAPLEFAFYLQRFKPRLWQAFEEMRGQENNPMGSYMERRKLLERVFKEITGRELDK